MRPTTMKQTLWNHIAKGKGEQIPPWLEALTLRVDGNTTWVAFPHGFFGAWFKAHKQDLFEAALLACYPEHSAHISYEEPSAADSGTKDMAANATARPMQPQEPQAAPVDNADEAQETTFNNFLYNEKNAVPIAILDSIAREGSESTYTRVLLCGPSGSGKTHLLQALAATLMRKHTRVCLAKHVQDFGTNRLTHQPDLFWQEYAALFLDDIQDLVAHPELQRTLIHCIDACPETCQIVLTAMGTFNDLDQLDQRLRTRLASGLLLELAEPDIDVRLRCIQQLCAQGNIRITRKQMLLLAQRCTQYRHIQGVLRKIVAFAKAHKRSISQADIELVLHTGRIERVYDYKVIMEAVAKKMHVSLEEILGKERKTQLVRARQLAMYMCRNKLGLSYPELGRIFGDKDHSTVIYAIKKIETLATHDVTMNAIIDELEKCL